MIKVYTLRPCDTCLEGEFVAAAREVAKEHGETIERVVITPANMEHYFAIHKKTGYSAPLFETEGGKYTKDIRVALGIKSKNSKKKADVSTEE